MSDIKYKGEIGTVAALSVGAGDIKLSFDKSNPAERIRAARAVKDMIRRGYALLVQVERDGAKVFVRATDFDENVCEYIIADLDPVAAAAADQREEAEQTDAKAPSVAGAPPIPRAGKRHNKRSVAAETTRAVGVGRIAGG